MSIYEDLFETVLDQLEAMEKTVRSGEIANICASLMAPANEEMVDKITGDLYDCQEAAYQDIDDRRLDRVLKSHGRIIAEVLVMHASKDQGVDRDLTDREFEHFSASVENYFKILDEGKRRTSRRDRDDDRDKRSSRRGARNNDTDRARRRSRGEPKGRSDRNQSDKRDTVQRDSIREEKQVTQVTTSKTLNENEIITSDNFSSLPKHLLDLPLYYVGLEKLAFTGETVTVFESGENFKVNYEKHRTDLYLTPNRAPINGPKTIEALEKDLLEAAQKTVKAFTEKEYLEPVKEGEDPKLEITTNKYSQPSLVLEGVYDLGLPLYGYEPTVRNCVATALGKTDLSDGVVAAAIQSVLTTVSNDFITGSDSGMLKEYENFKLLCVSMRSFPSLPSVKGVLEAAYNILAVDAFSDLNRLLTQAVCDAITVSTKVSVTTPALLVDYDGVMEYISQVEKEEPSIGVVISANLGLTIPMLEFVDNVITVVRGYIFLPYSKNELVFGSPHRYATVDETNKKDLFNTIDKLSEASVAEIGYFPYTTILTADNAGIMVMPNKSSNKKKSFYLVKTV